MKAIIDTCIIIDALQGRKPFETAAQALLIACERGAFEGCITSSSVTDIYYLTRRNKCSEKIAREIVADLLDALTVIETNENDCRRALRSSMPDFEDALMVEVGLKAGTNTVITRDLKDYRNSKLPVFTPEEFLKEIGIEGWG